MSTLEQRLEAFRKLPLRAQAAFIASCRANPVLAERADYLAKLDRAHQDRLQAASPEERQAYDRAIAFLTH